MWDPEPWLQLHLLALRKNGLHILHTYKVSRKLKINSYVINKLFKLQVFVV